MSPVRVKICGITRAEDAAEAVRLGANAVGFIFWPESPRVVTISQAAGISRALPPFVVRVGVFVNRPAIDVVKTVREVGLDVVQLHGDEQLDTYVSVGARLVKSIALDRDEAVAEAASWPSTVTPLVDAADRQKRGGTGRLADWTRAAALAARRPTILSGGLTPDNVREAIQRVRPMAVDVSSGVEERPGVKSHERLAAFFAAVAAAEEQTR